VLLKILDVFEGDVGAVGEGLNAASLGNAEKLLAKGLGAAIR